MKDLGIKHSHHMAAEPTKESQKSYPQMTIDHKSGMKLKKNGHMKIKYRHVADRTYRDGSGSTDIEVTHAEHINDAKEA